MIFSNLVNLRILLILTIYKLLRLEELLLFCNFDDIIIET